ncbi:hypothetical protein VPH35_115904 [Triticum aestivum]
MAVDKVVAGGGEVQQSEPEPEPAAEASTFVELGICPELVEACDAMGWKQPTKIQVGAIPHALKGRDLIGPGTDRVGEDRCLCAADYPGADRAPPALLRLLAHEGASDSDCGAVRGVGVSDRLGLLSACWRS